MRRKIVCLLMLVFSFFSLTSCKSLNKIKDFEEQLYKYSNKATVYEMLEFNNLLKEYSEKNKGKDYELNVYKYEENNLIYEKDGVVIDKEHKTLIKNTTSRFSNKAQVFKVCNEVNYLLVKNSLNEESERKYFNNNTLIYQTIDNRLAEIIKEDKIVYMLNNTFDDLIEKRLNPYTSFYFVSFPLLDRNIEYYIDDNIYTIVDNYEEDGIKHEKISQIRFTENTVTKVEVFKTEDMLNPNKDNSLDGTYVELNFKEQKITPCKTKGYVIKEGGAL